jgi:hypothetical protein
VRFHFINAQSALAEIPGTGLVPWLQGVLATKTAVAEECLRSFTWEQEPVVISRSEKTDKMNLYFRMFFLKITSRRLAEIKIYIKEQETLTNGNDR